MSKSINNKDLSNTLHLSECTDGFWLYDDTRGMNLSMRARTKEDAFVEVITYYQKRLNNVERKYRMLKREVEDFVESVKEEDD